jgi:hypothetical protein
MKNQTVSTRLAQNVFRVLQWGSFALLIFAGILAWGSLDTVQQITGLTRPRVMILQFLPLLHFLFFAFFFRLLSQLFRGFEEDSIFQGKVFQANRGLSWLCLIYAFLNVAQLFLMANLGHTGGGAMENTSVYTQQWILTAFVLIMGVVFFFNARVFEQGIQLREEQQLTI